MKKIVFSAIAFTMFSLISFANTNEKEIVDPSCEEDMFDAMEWAMEEGFDNQTVSNVGNWAYANCWLRQTSDLNPSF
ncbi:hypothetical protein FIA58_011720 [Flavobacterium jejuense]|uniref:Uncharacterized protein n=1 Tax=Flavobacterium jejuense TaxID=1544455 RepID=A0ABX0IRL9_9FLAO|nr:hypothetical protein [Flavobacterium jejuense]NHN26348.1 hypothetical protein [Flavobacterium jejuense]